MGASSLRYLPWVAFLAGCTCDPFGVDTARFTCTSQADCLEGFECRDVGAALECVKKGTPADAGNSDAGRLDAGPADAGAADGGDLDAGDTDAGDLDAGGVDSGIDAGFDAGVDAGFDAGFDAGVADAGNPNPATRLRFTTPPQTVAVSACSPVINIETLGADGGVRAVDTATTVGLQSLPASVAFYTASNCTGAADVSVVIGAAQSSSSFYATSATAGTYTLTVSSLPLLPASQQFVVAAPPTSLVSTGTPPNPVRGGTCLTAIVEARRLAVPTPVVSATSVGLTVSPAGAARFYSDGSCTTATTTATINAGTATATFFVKPLTAGSNLITATAPFGTANQTLVTTPIVRRGQCSFPASSRLSDGGIVSALTANCTFAPAVTDLSASLSLIQSTAVITTAELGVGEVRCRLSSVSNLACTRRADADPAELHYQVAEVPQGMLVQRVNSTSCPATFGVTTPVNQSRSFVLKELSNATATFDDEDMSIATLTAPTTLSLSPPTCQGHDIQVVDWAGLTVTQGTLGGGMAAGVLSQTVTGLPAASANRAVLLQPGTTLNAPRPVCSSLIRAALPTPSSMVLTRSAGDAGCVAPAMENVLYERIDFGNRGVVHEYTATFAPGVGTLPVTITPVDVTRSLVFASSQAVSGQGAGETDHGGAGLYTEGVFQLVLTTANTVTATRGQATSAAIITFYVAELLP